MKQSLTDELKNLPEELLDLLHEPISYLEFQKQFRALPKNRIPESADPDLKVHFNPFYTLLCMMMDKIGELKIGDRYVSETIKAPDYYSSARIKRKREKAKLTTITKLPKINFPKRAKPEARIMLINTPNIVPVDNKEQEVVEEEELNQVVNSNLFVPEAGGGYKRVTFKSSKYFDESMRLSVNPEEVNKSDIHPIYKYVPSGYTDLTKSKQTNLKFLVTQKEKMDLLMASNLTFVQQ